MLRVIVVAAALGAPGCVLSVELSGELEQASLDKCEKAGCGIPNSPAVAGVYFWALHSGNLANTEGVKITSVTRDDGVEMRLIADGDHLRGIDPDTNAPLADGTGLVDTRINLSVLGAPYQIRIAYVSPTLVTDESYWVDTQDRIEAYDLVYKPLFGPPEHEKPLCHLANDDLTSPMIRAIAYGGDTYDPDTKEITLGPATVGWMNIACKDGTLYKMLESGHTTAAANRLGIATSLDKRRSMINAFAMNACGTGEPFTVPGTMITLAESQLLLPGTAYQPTPDKPEAIWGPRGPLCLTWHRLADTKDDAAQIKSDIERTCRHTIASCDDWMLANWNTLGYAITGHP